MLHLLPEQQKKTVLSEYRKRLSIVTAISLSCIGVVGIMLLIPSYIYSQEHFNEVKKVKTALVDALEKQTGDKTAETVKNITENIAALQPLGSTELPSYVIDRVISRASSGIKIMQYAYKLEVNNTLSFLVVGRADTRNDLTQFIKVLQGDPYFEGAKLPLSSFTRERNIDFQFLMNVKGVASSSTSQ
ncbi:MAG: hypothetical protein RL094_88 [Candidatus Parcubacteria bacterium]|jgi:hypothetical protein